MGNHSNIPFSRVNHSKFMVTEKAAYIGERLRGGLQAGRAWAASGPWSLQGHQVSGGTHRGHTDPQEEDVPWAWPGLGADGGRALSSEDRGC